MMPEAAERLAFPVMPAQLVASALRRIGPVDPDRTFRRIYKARAPGDAVGLVVGASRADEHTNAVSEVSMARCLGQATGGRRRAERRQALPRRRSISPTGTPQICATWATFMPYFSQVRMRATCEGGISTGGGGGATGLSGSSRRADAGLIGSTRGLRADGSFGAVCWVAGVLTGGFDVNRASAAWRARVIRSRSSPRGCGCCCRLSKICSEWRFRSRLSKRRFVNFSKLDLGSRGALRKHALMARSRILAKAA